jgi:hypothetical protein
METAMASVRRPDVRELLDIYGVTGVQHEELLQLVDESRARPWWQQYRDLPSAPVADLEGEAASISQYSALLIPGLLQTEAYARQILTAIYLDDRAEEIQRRLQLRMDRQALLAKQKSPQYRVVIDEAALRRTVGDRQVMRAQLRRLIDASALENVTLQVLPFAAGAHPGIDGEFTIFSYRESTDPDVVYIENPVGEAYIEDSAATQRYNSIFQHLQTAALDPAQAIQVLADIEHELQTP